MVDFRSVIKFGDSSFIISMPKPWLEKNAIKKGDVVSIEEGPNNELIIRTRDQPKREAKEATINIDEVSVEGLKTKLISAYLNNYDIISITGKNVVSVSNDVRAIMHDLASIEIVEQTPKKIVARCFLDTTNLSLDALIRRIDNTVRTMLEDARESLLGQDLVQYVYQKEKDVTRLTLLALKVLKRTANAPEVAAQLGLTNAKMMKYWEMITLLENVADQAKKICKHVGTGGKIPKNREKLAEHISNLTNMYTDMMKAYYQDDKVAALDHVLKKKQLMKEYYTLAKNVPDTTTFAILEKSRSLAFSTFSIARLVLDA